MGLIRKDIDKTLLTSVIVLSVLVVATITFYEIKLKNTVDSYNEYIEISNLITAGAVTELNKTVGLKEMDKKYLELKYSELSAQNSKLHNEIENLGFELILARSTDEYQRAKDIGPVAQFRLIQSKNSEINKLKDRINILCQKFKSHNMSAPEC